MQNCWVVYRINIENISYTLNYEALECDPKPNPNIFSSSHSDLEKLIIKKQLPKWTQPVSPLSIGYADGVRCDVGRIGFTRLSDLTGSK